MADVLTLYECRNEQCTLGSRFAPGHFTGGITADQALAISGNPEAPHGEGICPNCGQAGVECGDHESVEGSDD